MRKSCPIQSGNNHSLSARDPIRTKPIPHSNSRLRPQMNKFNTEPVFYVLGGCLLICFDLDDDLHVRFFCGVPNNNPTTNYPLLALNLLVEGITPRVRMASNYEAWCPTQMFVPFLSNLFLPMDTHRMYWKTAPTFNTQRHPRIIWTHVVLGGWPW